MTEYRCIKCNNMLDSPQHEFVCGDGIDEEGEEDEDDDF